MLFKEEYSIASRLIKRGANKNYVNTDGKTALHLCLENRLIPQVKYLLKMGSNPHIMDLSGKDICDKVKDM